MAEVVFSSPQAACEDGEDVQVSVIIWRRESGPSYEGDVTLAASCCIAIAVAYGRAGTTAIAA
eukprot:IDg1993t1